MLKKRFISALLSMAILAGSAGAVSISDFPDANGHWAYDTLSKAVNDGFLTGSDGKISPDANLTTAQMAIILNRVLHADNMKLNYPNISQDQWYAKDANIAVSAGFLPYDGSLDINANVTRGQVFKAVADAFGLAEADPSFDSIKKFSDWNQMPFDQRRAAAVLVSKGLLNGSDNGGLNSSKGITRAEFMTLIYRIMDSDLIDVHSPWKINVDAQTENQDNQQLSENTSSETVVNSDNQTANEDNQENTEQTAENTKNSANIQLLIDMNDMSDLDTNKTYERVILSGDMPKIEQDSKDKIQTNDFVINTTGSDLTLTNESDISAQNIIVGSGNGTVTLENTQNKKVEITGSGRTVNLNGLKLDSLVISGINNTVLVDENTQIQNLKVQVGAVGNAITLNGNAQNANIDGNYTKISGEGSITNTVVRGTYADIDSNISEKIDDSGVDYGLSGATISIDTPKVPAGGNLKATITISGVKKPITASAQWYYEGNPDSAFANNAFSVSDGKTSTYIKAIEFSKNMKLWQNVKFVLSYKNTVTEQVETIAVTGDAQIENYPMSYYLPNAEEVLAKVNPTYHSWNTDYTQDEKTVFVNAKGYSSKTNYLLWVSRSAQKVNVFSGSQGNWTLIHEFDCATGKASSPTPIGVTEVTYKQTAWVTSSYECRPIVRFYPGTGYAFHSRLYYPGTNKVKDPSMGFPVSAGCVRMMDEGIYWIYNNIPSGTTVVIY